MRPSQSRSEAPFVVLIHFAEAFLLTLLFIVSLFVLAACASNPIAAAREPLPEEIVAAEDALRGAREAGLVESLPATLERAEAALTQAKALHARAQTGATTADQRALLTEAATQKAEEAELLVEQAVVLDQQVRAWDERIEDFFDEQLSQQLLAMLLAQALGAEVEGLEGLEELFEQESESEEGSAHGDLEEALPDEPDLEEWAPGDMLYPLEGPEEGCPVHI